MLKMRATRQIGYYDGRSRGQGEEFIVQEKDVDLLTALGAIPVPGEYDTRVMTTSTAAMPEAGKRRGRPPNLITKAA